MDDSIKKVEEPNIVSTEEDINFKKYVRKNQIIYYNIDNLIDKDNNEDLICVICFNVLKEPISCSDRKNCHSFCKECIDEFLKEKNNCPTCKENFEYKINNYLKNKLNNLCFKCAFQKEGCDYLISYSEYLNHINNCKYNNSAYECNIMKYNSNYKDFEKCGYQGNKLDIENHFKLCAYIKYKCSFCNKIILQMNLDEHIESECKIGIIRYFDECKYIGEKKNNMAEGYGILSFDGNRYEGVFKNDNFEGYGILYYSNGDRYEGELKDGKKEGYGILYYYDGDRYEGEFKNSMREGYGIYYFADGRRYEGEWKNNKIEGYGIYYYSNGDRYEGELKDCKIEGYGILYYSNGNKYEGEWKDDKREGYGIIYYISNGNRYEGEFKDGKRE